MKNYYSPYESVTKMLDDLGWRSLENRRTDACLVSQNFFYNYIAINEVSTQKRPQSLPQVLVAYLGPIFFRTLFPPPPPPFFFFENCINLNKKYDTLYIEQKHKKNMKKNSPQMSRKLKKWREQMERKKKKEGKSEVEFFLMREIRSTNHIQTLLL